MSILSGTFVRSVRGKDPSPGKFPTEKFFFFLVYNPPSFRAESFVMKDPKAHRYLDVTARVTASTSLRVSRDKFLALCSLARAPVITASLRRMTSRGG
jgi:hypothetical protein